MMEKLLSDLSLCFFGLLFLGLWVFAWVVSRREIKTPALDWQAAATTFIRVICGLILVYASMDKLGNAAEFSKAVDNYQILPSALVPLAAVVVPWLEFYTGLCLAFGLVQRGAALIFCALMAGYAFSLSTALLRGIDLNCGCFNMEWKEPETWLTVLRDVLLFAMGYIVLVSIQTYLVLGQIFTGKDSRS